MADTITNIQLQANVKTNLYATTGIDVGTKLSVQNMGSSTIRLQTKATEPLPTDGYNNLSPGNDQYSNEAGDSGAWAESLVIDGLIQVKGGDFEAPVDPPPIEPPITGGSLSLGLNTLGTTTLG